MLFLDPSLLQFGSDERAIQNTLSLCKSKRPINSTFSSFHLKALDINLVSATAVTIVAHYATAKITEMEVHTLVDHFESALGFIMEHPLKLVGDVELINDREMRLLISPEMSSNQKLNLDGKDHFYPFDNCSLSIHNNIPELIGLQVERTPYKIAVSDVFQGIHSSYYFVASIWPRRVPDL